MDTSYRLPLPFRAVETWGIWGPRWMPWQEGYPLAPGMILRPMQEGGAAWDLATRWGKPITREVLAYDPVPPKGCGGIFAAWLGNQWVECYYARTDILPFGRILTHNRGLKPDMTWGDLMANFPEISLTIRKETMVWN